MSNPEPHNDHDRFLARLSDQLDEIETQEIVRDFDETALSARGFIGKKNIEIKRTMRRQGTDREHLMFEQGVDFERTPPGTRFEDLDIEDYLFLDDVQADALIATREQDEQDSFDAGVNVRKEVEAEKELYFATQRGKALIVDKALCVLPSDVDSSVHVRVATDGMESVADLSPAFGQGKPLSVNTVLGALANAAVVYGIDREAIEEAVDGANQSRSRKKNMVVARATPARPGEDGVVSYTFETSPDTYGFKILPDGRIDYKNTCNIVMAEKGDRLAFLTDPTEGIPGTNVYGEAIAARTGKPAVLTAGQGVTTNGEKKEFYAEMNGSVMINGSVIEVVNTYVVEGDVDYSTGSIDFNGNVIINGTVKEGFEVKADGDIVIGKNAESSRLDAGRDVLVRGGIQGKGKGLVSAGRDVHAGYAQNARVEAQGNVYIENFSINSYIFTTKFLIMLDKRGVLIGGETYAQRGVDVKVMGSENGVKTTVEVGTDYLVQRKIEELDTAISFYEKNIGKIGETLKAVAKELESGIPAKKKELIRKAIEKQNALQQRCSVMKSKRSDLLEQSREKDVCSVKARQTCHTDVYIKMHEMKTVTTRVHENVRFYEDRKADEIATAAY